MKNEDFFVAGNYHLKSQAAIMEAYQKQVQAQLSGQVQKILNPYKPDITALLEKSKPSEYIMQLSPDVLKKVA